MQKRRLLQKIQNDFNLNGVSEVYFWKSEWEVFEGGDERTPISTLFIIYRSIFSIYFVSTLGMSLLCSDTERSLWPIYFTHWSYVIQTIYSFFALYVISTAEWRQQQPKAWGQAQDEFIGYSQNPRLSFPQKMTWTLFNMVAMIPFGVTLVYWAVVYESDARSTCATLSNYVLHAANSVMALLDIFIVALPIHLSHCVFGLTFMTCYAIFTVLYEVSGGVYEEGKHYIYKILDWRESPVRAGIYSIGLLLLFIFCHFIFGWGLCKLRTYLANKIITNKNYNPLYKFLEHILQIMEDISTFPPLSLITFFVR